MYLGLTLREIREKNNYTVAEMADKSERYSISHLKAIEDNVRETPLDVFALYCREFNLDANQMLRDNLIRL